MGTWIKGLILFVFALGVLIGSIAEQSNDSPSVDSYWARTSLSNQELFQFLDDRYCHSSDRYFLACLNAIQQVAVRYGHYFDPDRGLIEFKVSVGAELSEKQLLSPWLKTLPRRVSGEKIVEFQSEWIKMTEKLVEVDQKPMMIGAALNGFLSVFRDPHTYLIPVDYYKQIVASSEYRTSSYGFVITRIGGTFYLKKVILHSPADVMGLKRGDKVVNINDWNLKDINLNTLNEKIRNDKARTMAVTVLNRNGEEKIHYLRRTNQALSTVHIRYINGAKSTAILTIDRFARRTCEKVRQTLAEIGQKSVHNLIIDLRDNPGGQMDETGCVAGLFTGPERRIFTVQYADKKLRSESYISEEERQFNGRIVVLVNRGTASAAEILAGSLREYNKAILVGERTFGKGSFQEGDIWNQNSKIALFETKGFYYLPSGFSPQKIGLKPDILVSSQAAILPEAPNSGNREEDQYWSPLQVNQNTAFREAELGPHFESCINPAKGISEQEDPELGQAQAALNCWGVAQAVQGN